VDQRQRAAVGVSGLAHPTKAVKQLAPRRVQVAVVLDDEAIDDGEPRLGAIRFRDGDRPAQLDHRRVGQADELAVAGGDLGPVARLVSVQGRDRRLHDVRTPSPESQGPVQHRPPVGDLRGVPERAVLVGEQDQVAVPKPRPTPPLVQ